MKLLSPYRAAGLVSSALAFVALAQEPRTPPPPPTPTPQRTGMPNMRNFFGLGQPPDPEAVKRGQTAYVASCGFCHGSNAKGGAQGPDLVRSVLVLHDQGSGKEIGPVILNGRVEKGMPKFSMTEPQIKDIAAFLQSRSESAVNRMEYKIQNIVTGSASAGQSYFDGHCSSCHSATGDLAHIASRFEPVDLESRFLYPQTRRFPGMPAAAPNPKTDRMVKVTLPSGQTLSGRLSYLDDFNVSFTDASGDYHSVPLGTGTTVEVHDPLRAHAELLPQYSDADVHNVLAYLETLK